MGPARTRLRPPLSKKSFPGRQWLPKKPVGRSGIFLFLISFLNKLECTGREKKNNFVWKIEKKNFYLQLLEQVDRWTGNAFLFNPLDPTYVHAICGISPWFPENIQKFPIFCFEKYQTSKAYLDILIYQNYMISFAFDKDFDWL